MTKVNFILPFFTVEPGGGTKIMYEYANRLSERGYDVCIYHSNYVPHMEYKYPLGLKWIKNQILYYKARSPWFSLDENVQTKHVRSISDKTIRDAQVTIGTWWSVAFEISKLSDSKGKKINLIQGYETWTGHEDLVKESYKLPITHIVIADYLEELVHNESGIRPEKVYNAIDDKKFFIQKSIEDRNPCSILMLYSEVNIKGSKYGIEALKVLKSRFPELQATLFGTFSKPDDLESWIDYHRSPENLNELYNNSAVFLTVSLQEGWALPPCEAMFCGCALVATNIGGHAGYAIENKTALLIEPQNSGDTVEKLSIFIESNALRENLAFNGNAFVQKFKWDNSLDSLIRVMNEV